MSEAFAFQFYETRPTDFPSAANDAVFPSGRENSKWLRQLFTEKDLWSNTNAPPFSVYQDQICDQLQLLLAE